MKRGMLTLGLALLTAGCATITLHAPSGRTLELSPDEFAQYVARVNAQQARMSAQLIRSIGDFSEDDLDEPAQLVAAARKMARICEPFQQLVAESLVAEVTGKKPNMDNANSVPACEEATRDVQGLMP